MLSMIELNSVFFGYDRKPVLQNVNLKVVSGEFASIVGPNGGGKTTLVRLILGLLRPLSGRIVLFGDIPEKSRLQVGYTPQHLNVDMLFPVSVLDVVLMGRLGTGPGVSGTLSTPNDSAARHRTPIQNTDKEPIPSTNPGRSFWQRLTRFLPFRYSPEDRECALFALERMGIADLRSCSFGGLSGGQRQRVLIARALCANPKLLIMDEPTNNIDPASMEHLYELLQELNQTVSILIVSHDLGVVSKYVRSVICVNGHVAIHPTSTLNGALIRDLYGGDPRLVRHDHCCSENGHFPHFEMFSDN